jgi:hypothetical protein
VSHEPWIEGPAEILNHGLEHLQKDGDVDRRLAMISIDNSVELMLKTFFSLPRRAASGPSLSLKQRREIGDGFFDQLDALERYAPDRLEGVDLAAVEYYHGLRNELYHQGNGLTVERSKVQVYGDVARLLFRNLFGTDVPVVRAGGGPDLVWDLLTTWQAFSDFVVEQLGPTYYPRNVWERLEVELPARLSKELRRLRLLRNAVGHGEPAAVEGLTRADLEAIPALQARLRKQLGM